MYVPEGIYVCAGGLRLGAGGLCDYTPEGN